MHGRIKIGGNSHVIGIQTAVAAATRMVGGMGNGREQGRIRTGGSKLTAAAAAGKNGIMTVAAVGKNRLNAIRLTLRLAVILTAVAAVATTQAIPAKGLLIPRTITRAVQEQQSLQNQRQCH